MSEARDRGALALGGTTLRWGTRTYVMGIVNVTPDSFSGDGLERASAATAHAFAQRDAGADLLDVGGESTRPGYVAVEAQTETQRIVPVIAAIRKRYASLPITADTYKPAVARAARIAGADVVNSVWGASDELLEAVAELQMPIIATHNQPAAEYGTRGVVATVLQFLSDCARRAVARGIPAEHVILDPGIGFGKTAEHNIAVLQALNQIVALGFPTLLGASRKATIGKLTGRPPADRVYGTVAVTALAVHAGIDMVRVHDVAAARDAIAIADAVVRDWRPDGWIA